MRHGSRDSDSERLVSADADAGNVGRADQSAAVPCPRKAHGEVTFGFLSGPCVALVVACDGQWERNCGATKIVNSALDVCGFCPGTEVRYRAVLALHFVSHRTKLVSC